MKRNDLQDLSPEDRDLFKRAWETARDHHGDDFTFYLPGMIRYGRERGKYPAISITGDSCELLCEHCKGALLEPMIKVRDPSELIARAKGLKKAGAHGLLLSGGADSGGRLPWEKFYGAIEKVSQETGLYLSAHTGFPDKATCTALKNTGVKQGLIDVMGDDETARRIYHLPSLDRIIEAAGNIKESGLEFAPHIVVGLYYGKIRAEYEALEMISRFRPSVLVVVVLTPLKGLPMARVTPPSPLETARLIARARLLMPDLPISLGCERPRNRDGRQLEVLAVRAGATRMAVWSEEAIEVAEDLGLKPRFQPTCCSLEFRPDFKCLGPVDSI
ncbi:MAG: radical SAM protein [Deltaproteobacteria bacterium]|nr:radical SAM protein [Deltaproteobacteria bacterium]